MPQNVMVSVVGEGIYMPKLVKAILAKEVIPPRNLFLSAKNKAACQAAEGYAVSVCEDDLSAMIKSEIVLVAASKREMPTELAKISSSSQKRVVVTVCDSEQVNLAYLTDRIAAATEFIAAVLHRDENGKLYATYEISQKARLFLHQPCRDLVNAMCDLINEEG
ncbi:hypothetical protein [Agathobaculum sp.]|uniref:hypothetical protein n=1 Tax=Agathobaculum sp. TaxID=2048138 RepID=UPI0039A3F696